MQNIGFLSFGHWQAIPGSKVRTAADALGQTVELAQAAEEIGLQGAYVRVHHFARQLSSPFPLLAAMAARTHRIELGTGVIDMRYENPLYMAEEAAVTDLLSAGRLQLGVSRGSPSEALRGYEAFGYQVGEGDSGAEDARSRTELFRAAISGRPMVRTDPRMAGVDGTLAVTPQSPGLAERIWWGSGTRDTARWAGEQGYSLMSSTLLSEDTGVPFGELQAEQIDIFRRAFAEAGWAHVPRVSVSRSVLPITSEEDRRYFGASGDADQVGLLEGVRSRFGRSYAGEPDQIAAELAADPAVQAADTLLVTVPNMLGVDDNARLLSTIARDVAPALGWRSAA